MAARDLFVAAVIAACSPWATGCAQHFDKVDVKQENDPPLPVTSSAAGITIPEGIGIAVTITAYINDQSSNDDVVVQSFDPVVDVQPGLFKNEFFITGLTPGSGNITFGLDPSVQNTDGVVSVPVTVVAQ